MNFIENETPTKLRGGYYTPELIASFLLRWVLQTKPKSILEPSSGDGIFFKCLNNLDHSSLNFVLGIEILSEEARKSKSALSSLTIKKKQLLNDNFLEWFLSKPLNSSSFDAIVGNPPFIRYQYLDSHQQFLAKSVFDKFGLAFTKHTNAWVPFVVSSIGLLNPGGRIAMVLPAELLHILHSESLRNFIAAECSRILIVDPKDLWFENTLQGAILLLAEKKQDKADKSYGVGIAEATSNSFLLQDPEEIYQKMQYVNGEVITGKWMRALLTKSEREILTTAKQSNKVKPFKEIAEVSVGIVTGANDYFLVPNSVVEDFQLQDWAYPMFGRSEHVPGVIYDHSVHGNNEKKQLPTNLIWFTKEQKHRLPAGPRRYVEFGEAKRYDKRYKCRIREPWFAVPHVYSTKVGMLKRSHDMPRMVLNKMAAYTTDTVYRINSKKGDSISLVYSFINSLTALTAEIEGRHYGGGVLELVPSEIRKLLIPLTVHSKEDLAQLDGDFRNGFKTEDLLEKQSEEVLKHVGLKKSERYDLLNAWHRLKSRRQRK